MWDDRAVFRGLWQRIARLFGGGRGEERHVPIPAPETLVAKVQNVKNKDRDILRVAGEAVRRGHPDQAVIAYWKAVQVYLKDGQLLKAVAALKMILQHSPEDLAAFNALADAYEALDRRRDAANTCLWIADIHARRGEHGDALAVLYRSIDLDPMVKGARERIQALGGELPTAARPLSQMGPQLRLQSKQDAPARPASQQIARPASQQMARPASQQIARPPSHMAAGLPPIQGRAPGEVPAIVGIPLSPPPRDFAEEEPMEMPGERAFEDDDKLELDIEGDDALDFPNDSLVLPVTEAKSAPAPEPEPGTVLAQEDEIEAEGAATIAMAAIDTDADAATIAMQALSDQGEMMSEDLAGDATVLAMEAPPWDVPTDEQDARELDSFEEVTEAPAEPSAPVRKFGIPSAATTVDVNPPSSMIGSEHDQQPKIGIPGESTRAYSVEELRRLGVKPPTKD